MKRFTLESIFMTVALAACVALMSACDDSEATASNTDDMASSATPRNVIMMVPDGMGLSNVTAARIYKNGPNGDPLYFEQLPYIGYQRTHSRNSTVTDSAAAGSAWASGDKFNNGEISCIDDNADGACDGTRKNDQTILEIARDLGKATGLVANSDITHATPAVWGAHVHSRKCESEIFAQMLDLEVDVMLGGGVATNRGPCMLPETDDAHNEALIASAVADGYTYVTTRDELTASAGASRLLGLFNDGGLTPIVARPTPCGQPTLKEMTEAALDVLSEDPDGFFLMVEGSQIDWANHARNVMYQIEETLDFDDAVKVVMDWMAEDLDRQKNTLLIVVPDHETGGVIIDGPYGRLSEAGDTGVQLYDLEGEPVYDMDGYPVMEPDLTVLFGSNPTEPTESANHTAVDTLIWSNSPACARALDNTDLYDIMRNFMQAG